MLCGDATTTAGEHQDTSNCCRQAVCLGELYYYGGTVLVHGFSLPAALTISNSDRLFASYPTTNARNRSAGDTSLSSW